MLVKRTLTSMQIAQFLVGATFAMSHTFISYVVPVNWPEVEEMIAAAAGAEMGGHHSGHDATANATAVMNNLKALVFATSPDAATHAPHKHQRHHQDRPPQFTTLPRITTTGATFAIYLDVLYLAPLTYLFGKFFVASYLRRSTAVDKTKGTAGAVAGLRGRRLSGNMVMAEKAGWDAARRVEEEVYG